MRTSEVKSKLRKNPILMQQQLEVCWLVSLSATARTPQPWNKALFPRLRPRDTSALARNPGKHHSARPPSSPGRLCFSTLSASHHTSSVTGAIPKAFAPWELLLDNQPKANCPEARGLSGAHGRHRQAGTSVPAQPPTGLSHGRCGHCQEGPHVMVTHCYSQGSILPRSCRDKRKTKTQTAGENQEPLQFVKANQGLWREEGTGEVHLLAMSQASEGLRGREPPSPGKPPSWEGPGTELGKTWLAL